MLELAINKHGESGLSRAKIVKEDLVEKNTSFFAVYLETKNANQLFLS